MKNHIQKVLFFLLAATAMLSSGCLKEDENEAIGTPNSEASLYVIRNAFKGQDITLNKDLLDGANVTGGVVISHYENGNFPEGYIAIENVWRGQIRGIMVQVNDPASYRFGDSVRIQLEGARLTRQNGPLAITNIGGIEKISDGHQKVHRPVSIGTLQSNPDRFESTLISITADVVPEPTGNENLAGRKSLLDGEQNSIEILTSENASFGNTKIAPSAAFQGIPLTEGDKLVLRLQTSEDMAFPSGKLYAGWPETFEEPSHPKGSYNMPDIGNNVGLPTGEWHLYQAIFGSTAGRDRIVSGLNAIRLQQNRSDDEYVQMNFDVPDGASKVTFWYGAYYNDQSSTFKLEYSTDHGATWQQVGEQISDAHTFAQDMNPKQAIFLMNIPGPVRFRVNKLGLGTSNNTVSNGRLGIDDIAIYKSY